MKPYNGLHETEGCRAILKDQYKALKVRARRVLGHAMRQEIEDYGSSNGQEESGTEDEQEEKSGTENEQEKVRKAQAGQEKAVPDNWHMRTSWVWERDGCGLP